MGRKVYWRADRLTVTAVKPLEYRFTSPVGAARALARGWLALGVVALAGAGLLAMLLVLSRTPGIQNVFPLRDFFRAALIVHVDLSVLIWFVAFGGVFWSLAGNQRFVPLGWLGLWLTAAGTALLVASPFFPNTEPLLNNYIPVLQQPVFFVGLSLAGAGFGFTLLRALLTLSPNGFAGDAESALRFGAFMAAIAGSLALAGFVISWLTQPLYSGQALFEAVFWGGGHTLQFQHALLMVVAWLWLASELGASPGVAPRVVASLFALAALPLVAMPVIYAYWPVATAQHTAYFARLMEYGHPLMLPLIAIAAYSLRKTWSVKSPAKSAFVASIGLFAAGGVLAYLIHGVNVVIPAHYHGSIVGVTLAFMGISYLLLPKLGFGTVSGAMARWQPYVYGGGQLMHILGLAWSGGYGVQRKVAGAEQILTSGPQKIGMGMMGLGGVIAIIGGVMFVVVCLRAMASRPTR
jgi:cytochrome c oxidase subunit I